MPTYEVTTDKGTYEVDTEDPTSKLESFGRGAMNNFPLAKQAVAGLSEGDYSKNLANLSAKAASSKAANPISYGAGAVTGAVAPMMIPGVGEAMAASPIAANAAYGAASAIGDTDLSQQPGEAAKQALMGGAIGGATAGVIGKIMPEASNLERISQNQGVKSAGLRPGSLVDDTKFGNIGKYMKDNDLVQGSLEQRIAKVEALKQQHGDVINQAGLTAAPLEDFATYTDPLMEKASKYTKSYNADLKSQGQTYINGAKDIQQNGKTFADLQQIKSQYGDMAFDANHQLVNKAAADVYSAASDAMKSIISKSPEEYQAAMTGYSHDLDLSTGLSKQLGQERGISQGTAGVGGHGLHSIIRQVPGVSNPYVAIPGGAALAAAGHPVLGAALGLHSVLGSPQTRSAFAGNAAKAVGPIGNAIKTGTTDWLVNHIKNDPQLFGAHAPALQQAYQKGGNQGAAATNFVLSSQDPAYNQKMMDLRKQEE